jgi:hypothetical protein
MHRKQQTLAVRRGNRSLVQLPLEFEGKRAFAVWDSVQVHGYHFKARIEIDPKLLRKQSGADGTQYFYCGELELPCPELN